MLDYILKGDKAFLYVCMQLLHFVVALGKFFVEGGAEITTSDGPVLVRRLQVVDAALAEVGQAGYTALVAVVVTGQIMNMAGFEFAKVIVTHFDCLHLCLREKAITYILY